MVGSPVLDGFVPPLIVLAAAAVAAGLARVARGSARTWAVGVVLATTVATAAGLELRMGRPLTYRHGPMRLWVADIQSDQNSQQIADPYTFTHVVHGAVFYGLARAALGPSAVATRLVAAVAAESAWEALENTDMVIERYRAATVSLGYYGDSVLNSVADILACALGFLLTWRLPTRVTIVAVVVVEVLLAVWIRDNLTLNVLMLVHPVQAVRAWQEGA